MKIAVIYYSKHHGNTKKLLDAIAKSDDNVTLIDACEPILHDLQEFGLVGFASGIYFSKFHKSVIAAAREHLPLEKNIFLLYTCGRENKRYTKEMRQIAEAKDCKIVGIFGSLGFDTMGPFKLVGGVNKTHPDRRDITDAVKFFRQVKAKM